MLIINNSPFMFISATKFKEITESLWTDLVRMILKVAFIWINTSRKG